jgi:hypothetical protein
MTSELVAMLGGGVTGFVMKLISAQMNIQANAIDAMIKKQGVSDDSFLSRICSLCHGVL